MGPASALEKRAVSSASLLVSRLLTLYAIVAVSN
jgi:hypothetical protein